MENKSLGELLKDLLKQAGLSQNKLANLSGVDRATINKLISGKATGITLDTARKLAPPLGVSPAVFLEGKEDAPIPHETPEQILERLRLAQPISIPLFTDYPVHAGSPVEPTEYVYLSRARAAGKNIQAFPVKGTCLEPDIKEGNIVFIDTDASIEVGDIITCVVSGELHIGKLKKIAGELYLQNNHGQFKFSDCTLAAPVIEITRRLK